MSTRNAASCAYLRCRVCRSAPPPRHPSQQGPVATDTKAFAIRLDVALRPSITYVRRTIQKPVVASNANVGRNRQGMRRRHAKRHRLAYGRRIIRMHNFIRMHHPESGQPDLNSGSRGTGIGSGKQPRVRVSNQEVFEPEKAPETSDTSPCPIIDSSTFVCRSINSESYSSRKIRSSNIAPSPHRTACPTSELNSPMLLEQLPASGTIGVRSALRIVSHAAALAPRDDAHRVDPQVSRSPRDDGTGWQCGAFRAYRVSPTASASLFQIGQPM